MNLDDLIKMRSEAERLESNAANLREAQARVAIVRKSCRPEDTLSRIVAGSAHRVRELGRPEFGVIAEVINECKHDVLRLVEMKLAVMARTARNKAIQRKALVDEAILPTGTAPTDNQDGDDIL